LEYHLQIAIFLRRNDYLVVHFFEKEIIMGFFDSNSTTNTATVAPSQSGTVNSLGAGYNLQSNVSPAFSGSSGNYAPDYSFSTISAPTVNSTTNLSLQLASGSPGANFNASQTATGSSSLLTWILAGAGVVVFFWLYHRYK
jgi:hypothetical protein